MRKKLLLLLTFLTVQRVEAQTIGCFVDFENPSVCDGAGLPAKNYQNYGSLVQNQLRYGFVAAQFIDTYLVAFQEAERFRVENLDSWQACENARTSNENSLNQCIADYGNYYKFSESRKASDSSTIRRLKKKLAALRR